MELSTKDTTLSGTNIKCGVVSKTRCMTSSMHARRKVFFHAMVARHAQGGQRVKVLPSINACTNYGTSEEVEAVGTGPRSKPF